MTTAFDLDGTLIDSRIAVLEAYRAAGVEPPDDWWGRPWQDWLSDPHLHTLKNLHYPMQLLLHGRELPASNELRSAIRRGESVLILTAASIAGLRASMSFLQIPMRRLHFNCGCSADRKIRILLGCTEPGVYWDDDRDFLDRVERETTWKTQITGPSFSSRLLVSRPASPLLGGQLQSGLSA